MAAELMRMVTQYPKAIGKLNHACAFAQCCVEIQQEVPDLQNCKEISDKLGNASFYAWTMIHELAGASKLCTALEFAIVVARWLKELAAKPQISVHFTQWTLSEINSAFDMLEDLIDQERAKIGAKIACLNESL